jgi:insulin-like growth factor 2 mRNA-binding protein 1
MEMSRIARRLPAKIPKLKQFTSLLRHLSKRRGEKSVAYCFCLLASLASNAFDNRLCHFRCNFNDLSNLHRAASGLNGAEFEGSNLITELLLETKEQSVGGASASATSQQRRNQRNRSQYGNVTGGPGRQTDFPLRVLVASDMVGAIIGRQGSTIRQITQQSRARVDVHRKDNVGSLEKAITIYGNPENCTMACKRILEVMQQEANNTKKG